MNSGEKAFKHVFGPVPSRRLGRSLGVELAPRKFCSFDCVYCQVGRTDHLTTQRSELVSPEAVLAEIRAKLRAGARPDYITLSGSGEPTLNTALEEIIAGIRAATTVPVAILTNGTLLYNPAVRRACAKADVVLPTFDAPDEATFRALHRPALDLTLEQVIEGLIAFRSEFSGQIWLEVFVVPSINSAPEQMRRLAGIIERINPDRIQLNTAVRPTADPDIAAMSEKELQTLCAILGPKASVIADFKRPDAPAGRIAAPDEVLATIRRRPVTAQDIATGMRLSQAEVLRCVNELVSRNLVVIEKRGEKQYFRAVE